MKRGYARVSTQEQDLNNQLKDLKDCEIVYQEKVSSRLHMLEREKMLLSLQPGDIVVVTKLDRISRSLQDLIQTIKTIQNKQAGFECVTQPVLNFAPNTKLSSTNNLMLNILGSIAEFERDMISERIKDALSIKRTKVCKPGSRPCKVNKRLLGEINKLKKENLPRRHICKILSISNSTYARYTRYGKKLKV